MQSSVLIHNTYLLPGLLVPFRPTGTGRENAGSLEVIGDSSSLASGVWEGVNGLIDWGVRA